MVFSQLSNQVFLYNMRVPLSCRNGRMSKEFLYYPNVHAIPQEQCGDRVTQHVWCHMSLYSGVSTKLRNDVCHPLSGEPLAGGVQEKRWAFGDKLGSSLDMLSLNQHGLLVYDIRQSVPSALTFNSEDRVCNQKVVHVQG